MVFRFLYIPATLLILGVLLPGCSSVAPTPRSKASAAESKTSRNKARSEEADFEHRVKAHAHFAAGLSYDLNERPDLALEEFWQAAQADPTYEPVVVEVARRLIRNQKPERAIEILTQATSLPSASGTLFAWLGLAYAQTSRNDLAIAASRTAIKKMPRGLPAYQNLAQIYLQNNRTNEALEVLDEAARQPSESASYFIDLAELYTNYGRSQPAAGDVIKQRVREVIDRAASMNVTNPIVLNRLADYYFSMGELKKAEALYLQLIENADLPVVRGRLAEIYLRNGQKEKASEQLEVLTRDDPTNPQAHAFLGAIAMEEKKYTVAAEHFERALLLNPDLEQIYYDLAGLKITLKKPEEAMALMDKARSRFKMNFVMEFYSGVVQSVLKRYSEAIKYFTSAEVLARAKDPERLNHFFYFQLGSAYERVGDAEQAEKYFQKCLELSPNYTEALNYLGYMWADRGTKLEQARTLIEKAVQLEPNNAAYLDSLGWVLFKLRQPKEALGYILKAVEHTEEPDATLYDHLGDIYSALQRHSEAREAWGKALKVEPNEQIKKKLEAVPASSNPPPP